MTLFWMMMFGSALIGGFIAGGWYVGWSQRRPATPQWKAQQARSAVKYYRKLRDQYQYLLDKAEEDLHALEPYTPKQPASES